MSLRTPWVSVRTAAINRSRRAISSSVGFMVGFPLPFPRLVLVLPPFFLQALDEALSHGSMKLVEEGLIEVVDPDQLDNIAEVLVPPGGEFQDDQRREVDHGMLIDDLAHLTGVRK